MKVIDIDEVLEIIDKKFDEVIYKTLNKNDSGWGDVCMFPNTRELFNLKIALINKLNTLKIIEEPKEELEEIELIDIHYVNDKCIFKVNGQSVDETIAIKVNELIANQNKIIRELKTNKEQ